MAKASASASRSTSLGLPSARPALRFRSSSRKLLEPGPETARVDHEAQRRLISHGPRPRKRDPRVDHLALRIQELEPGFAAGLELPRERSQARFESVDLRL